MPQQDSNSNTLDVLIVGAGFGGVGAAIKLRERGIDNFRVYDKASGIGGTWWHNTYPGAACDIPSHLYCYSFEPNPEWSRKYSTQPEIQAYIEHCAHKYDVAKRIELNREIREINLINGVWVARFIDGQKVSARHVIFATGGLHMPAWPKIADGDEFSGTSMHSAQWDHQVDFNGKRVAVIGSAASAIQLIPELAKVAAHLDVYQRTPNYIARRNDRPFKSWEKKLFARLPWLHRFYRHSLFMRGEWILFPVVKTSNRSRWRELLQGLLRKHISASVKDPELARKMLPEYDLGCKRILIADNFYTAVNRDNVKVITQGIERVDQRGPLTCDGESHPADIIVYATGFDLENYLCAVDIRGSDGTLLADRWEQGPDIYKGGFIPGLPNFYMTTGPNTGVGTTSVVFMIEAQLQLILEAIVEAGSDKLIEVKEAACARYTTEIQQALQQTVWAGACDSWYKKENGDIDTLYPYNARAYQRDHRKLALADFTVYPRNHSGRQSAV